MRRNRRQLLKLVGTGGIAALAGCGGSADTRTETPEKTAKPEPSEPKPEPAVMLQQARLMAADGEGNDEFGLSIALSGDGTTAVVGARRERVGQERSVGAVYVFTESDGSWNRQARLTPPGGEFYDYFGNGLDISNDGQTVVIGSPHDDDPNGHGAGSAYVFVEGEDGWQQTAKLAPRDGDADDEFGFEVAVSGDGSTAVLTAYNDEDPGGNDSGSAYVFAGNGGAWRQTAKLTPTDIEENDHFGRDGDLSRDGRTAVVGAHANDNTNGESDGSAYVFVEGEDGVWSQRAKLTPNDGQEYRGFGESVALSGDGTTILASDAGRSVRVFSLSSGSWRQQAKLTSNDGGDNFGFSLGLSADGTRAVIGALYDENRNGDSAGSAHIFSQSDSAWQQEGEIIAEDGDANDEFGSAAGMSSDGNRVLIGAWEDATADGERAGSAYVFE